MYRWMIVVGCLAMACLAAPAGASAQETGTAARTCKPPAYPGSGYFTSLSVRGVGCKQGRRVTLAHYRCRTARSKAGRCSRRVLGYRCTERRQSIPTEINGRVTCTDGGRRVVYTYQQNR